MELDETQLIDNDGDSHKYFHQMLNMADDDLDPYEYRLLGHYIRVGKCKQGLTKIAKTTRMGKAKVILTRAALEEKGYIKNVMPSAEDARKGKTVHTTVIDRWAENIARYSKAGSNPYQPSTNQNQLPGTNQNRKNNSIKKNQEEESPNGAVTSKKKTSYSKEQLDALHDAICEVWRDLTPDMAIVNSIKQLLLALPSAKGEWKRCACNPPVYADELKLWRAWYRGDVLVRKPEQIQRSIYEYRRIMRLEADRTPNGQQTDNLVSQWDTDNEPIQQGVDYT